jgi:diacylglycerol kinase (ATP)
MNNSFDCITIIFNPESTGDGPSMAKELASELKAEGFTVPVELVETKHAGHAVELACQAAANGKPLVISVSGDGGYNEVVNGVLASGNGEATAAVLAAGNANDHARVMQDEPLLDLIKKGNTTKIDLLQMTIVNEAGEHISRYAHSYIGFGLTPTVALELEKGKKGSLKEIMTTLKTFGQFESFEVEYADGSRAEIDSLIFANIAEMAKVATLSDEGSPDDGVFEVITIPHVSKARAAYYAAKAAVKSLGNQPSVRSFEFKTLQPMPSQLDGELWELKEAARVVIRCQRKALKTLI